MDQVGDLHTIAVCVLAWAKDMAIQVNRFFGEGKNRRDLNRVAILYLEFLQRFGDGLLIIVGGNIQAKHGPALVRLHAVHINMAQSAGG